MRTSSASTKYRIHPTIRTCIACRIHENKTNLVRIVRTAQGNLDIDTSGTLAGRGAYLCKNVDCWENGFVPQSLQASLNLVKPPTKRTMSALTKKARDIILESLKVKKGHKND